MSLGQRMRAVTSLVSGPPTRSTPPTPIASVESDWDDDVVDFQYDSSDATADVAVKTLEAAAAAEKQSMADVQAPKVESGPKVETATNGATPEPAAALPVMIRIAGNGAVVMNKGGSEELAGVVAYAHRLIELVGDMLGLERFMAIECAFKAPGEAAAGGSGRGASQERCLLFAEENGDTVLVRPRAEGDLRALRETLGL
jgi:hypothetical protein